MIKNRPPTNNADDRKKFIEALRGTIREEKDKQVTFTRAPGADTMYTEFNTLDCLEPKSKPGAVRFTQQFQKELKLIAEDQLGRLEALERKAAASDMFGVLRQPCNMCQTTCLGYYPQGVACPSGSKEFELPSYCRNCGCPASLHKVIKTGGQLPKDSEDALTSFNIRQSELNFNAVLAVFEIENSEDIQSKTSQIIALLSSEGLELVSVDIKSLEINEALHLRSRQLQIKENQISLLVSSGFDADADKRASYIRGASGSQQMFNASTNCDIAALNKEIRAREKSIQRKSARFINNMFKDSNPVKPQTKKDTFTSESSELDVQENLNTQNQARPLRSTFGKSGSIQNHQQILDDLIGNPLQASMGPRSSIKWFDSTNKMSDKNLNSDLNQRTEALQILAKTISESKELANMLLNPHLVMIVSSANQQNIAKRIKYELWPSYQKLSSGKGIKLSYISSNKIDALEDSVLFSPGLFRLRKSIVVTEPIEPLYVYNTLPVQLNQEIGKIYTMEQWVRDIEDNRKQILAIKQNKDLNQSQKEEEKLQKLENQERQLLQCKPEFGFGTQTFQSNAFSNSMQGQVFGKTTQNLTRQLQQFARKEKEADTFNEGGSLEKDKPTWNRIANKTLENYQKLETPKKMDELKMLNNYSTMVDFFDYSGIDIQSFQTQANMTDPPFPGFAKLSDKEMEKRLNESIKYQSRGYRLSQNCNIFALAKVGSQTMIFPSSLDVSIQNFQDSLNYIQVADRFFPEAAKQQHSIVVIRPQIVQNGMADLFVAILKANDFLILERQSRVLTKQEASYLCTYEKIDKKNIKIALDYAMSGASEILVVSKIGAVYDLHTICHGSQNGRRRTALIDEDTTGTRKNVDSVNAIFEIAPFSSFNELIDLQDFLVQHGRLRKYTKKAEGNGKAIDALAVQQIEEIRLELCSFQRSFNLSAVAPKTETDAIYQMSLFCPKIATFEEIILVLNPIYNDKLHEAEALLVRMQYLIVKQQKITLNEEQAQRLLDDKYKQMDEGQKFINLFYNREVHLFHLSKMAAAKEAYALFSREAVVLEDHLYGSSKILKHIGPFMTESMPFLFLLMDSDFMFEQAMQLLYSPELSSYTASDFQVSKEKRVIGQILEVCLCTTAGESILKVVHDVEGNLVPYSKLKEVEPHTYCQISGLLQNFKFIQDFKDARVESAQFQIMLSRSSEDSSVSFVAEGNSRHLYEIRVHKISQKGDFSLTSNFDIDMLQLEEFDEIQIDQSQVKNTKKSVKFEQNKQDMTKSEKNLVEEEIKHFLAKFKALNFYYIQVNKHLGGGITPSFYRYKVSPLECSFINRVYEVEEHVGKSLLEEAALMHLTHLKAEGHAKSAASKLVYGWKEYQDQDRDQKSLPAFILGRLIALLCKKLERVQLRDKSVLQGAGSLIYSQKLKSLRFEYEDPKQYFIKDKRRFEKMQEYMKTKWNMYVSTLEIELIQEKLETILQSLTYKYTRQPAMLSLIPDHINESNLRVQKTIKLHNPDYEEQSVQPQDEEESVNLQQFYKEVYGDPNRSKDLEQAVGSVLHVISMPDPQEVTLKRDPKGLQEQIKRKVQTTDSTYTVTKSVCITQVEPAKRPKYQLIAAVIYLINFKLRKVNRRAELFSRKTHNPATTQAGRGASAAAAALDQREAERIYDEVLDAILAGITDNYGNDEVNHVLDLIQLQRGGQEALFEAVIKQKMDLQIQSMLRRKELQKMKIRSERIKKRKGYDIGQDDFFEEDLKELLRIETGKFVLERDETIFEPIQKFLKQKQTQGMSGQEHDEFKELLSQTKAKLGSNVKKLAEEFVIRSHLACERRDTGKGSIQEKISFVKMEYFLYGFEDAHQLMQQLQKLGQMQIRINEELESALRTQTVIEEKIYNSKRQNQREFASGNSNYELALRQYDDELQFIKDQVIKFQRKEDDLRYKRAQKETELMFILRELAQCEIHAPESYFDGDRLLKQGRMDDLTNVNDEFSVPITTFWIPTDLGVEENHIDPKSKRAKDEMFRERFYGQSDQNEIRGMFLAESIKKEVIREFKHEQTTPAYTKPAKKKQEAAFEIDEDFKMKTTSSKEDDRKSKVITKKKRDVEYETWKQEREKEPVFIGDRILLRNRELQPYENKEDWTFKKLENRAFTREQDMLNALSNQLREQIAPKETPQERLHKFDPEFDPFGHLKNKELADNLISEAVENFFNFSSKNRLMPGLNQKDCKKLALEVHSKMKNQHIKVEDFDELNFKTSFRIYKEQGPSQQEEHPDQIVQKNQLCNFVKSVFDI